MHKVKNNTNVLIEKILAFILLVGIIFMLFVDYGYAGGAWYTFLTYTFLSNLAATIFFQLRGAEIIKNNDYKSRVWQVCITANLTLTALVYWLLLAKNADNSPLSFSSSFYVHMINPLLVAVFYIWQTFKTDKKYNIKFAHFSFSLIFPITWFVMQQIMWYLGGISFYDIFDANKHSYFIVYLYIILLAVMIIVITMVYIVINNYVYMKFKNKKTYRK